MNNRKKLILTIILLIGMILLLSACTKEQQEGTITVIFDGNGGTLIRGKEIQTITFNSELIPPEYSKEGYSFQGWSIHLNEIFTNTKVMAVWMRSFDVTFDGNGGQLLHGDIQQKVTYGSSAVEPLFEKDGFSLSWDINFDIITEDTAIIAVWTPTYTVTFNPNGGAHISGQKVQTIVHGNSAIAPVFTKEMYSLSWDKDFENITSDLTVEALWEIKIFTVAFRSNGGQLISGKTEQIVSYGSAAIPPIVQKEGYELQWDKSFYNITNNTIISAIWHIKTYTVTFDGDGGVLIKGMETQEIEHDAHAIAPTYYKEGFIFSGWSQSLNNITSNLIITAQWLPAT